MAALPSGLRYTQKEPATADQLMHRERDPLAALFAFAMNTGQHRFQEIIESATVDAVDPAVQSRFYDLLEAEFPAAAQGDVYQRFTERWNIEAPILACAACGVRQVVNDPSASGTRRLRELTALQYTEDQVAKLNSLPEEYRPAISHYRHDEQFYHVHQDLVHFPHGPDEPHIEICLPCWQAVQKNQIPKYAVANGVDFGSATRLQLPPLHLVEQYLVARSIVFISLVKLNAVVQGTAQTGKRGHVITFPHQGPAGLAEHTTTSEPEVFPNLDAVSTNVLVCFVGSRPEYDAFVPDRPGRITELHVRKEVVYRWLQALKALHPLYADIVIDESQTMYQSLDAITPTLWQQALILDDENELSIEKVIERERVSHRPLGVYEDDTDQPEPVNNTEPEWPPLPTVMVTKMPNVNPGTLPPVTAICAAVERALESTAAGTSVPTTLPLTLPMTTEYEASGDVQSDPQETDGTEPPANVRSLLIQRATEPINEFTENDRLFYSAFPFIFLLGRGLQQVGSVPKAARRHLLLQYTNAAASCARLIHLLFDQLQRHATTVQTAVYVKSHPSSFQAFAEWQADDTFLPQLQEAARYPERTSSKELAKRVLNVVAVVAPKIPFTTSARKSAMPKLLALAGNFGLPSVFLTFAPDDAHGTLNLRLSLPSSSNLTFPALDDGFLDALRQGRSTFRDLPLKSKDLFALLASGPVAAAEIFRLLVDRVFIDILGLTPVTATRQTSSLVNRTPGLLGTPLAAFGCVEEQARGSPHIHVVYWGGLPPNVLQAIGTTPLLVDRVIRKLDEVFNGTARPLAHLKDILRRRLEADFQRPALYPAHHPLLEPDLFQEDVDRTAASVHHHKHNQTCHKPKIGKEMCRLGRPQPLLEASRAVQIIPSMTDDGRNSFEVLDVIQPLLRRTPATLLDILKPDPRLIIYELRRPILTLQSTVGDSAEEGLWNIACGDTIHHVPSDCAAILNELTPEELLRLERELASRNGLIVEHSPLLAALLVCNTNVSLLGSAAQAKAILCYLLLYVTKTTNELTESIALLYNARRRAALNPSIAEDANTPHRKARLFLHKLLNDISGRVEVSSTMAALCLLGGEAEVFSHQFFYVFVTSAIRYAKATRQSSDTPTGQPSSDRTTETAEGEEPVEVSLRDDLELNDAFDLNVPLEMPITIEEGPPPTLTEASAPLYRSGANRVPVHQHEHYAMRGPELAELCLYEYAALINIVPRRQNTTDDAPASVSTSQTRPANGTFRFASNHKLYDSHHQQLRSKEKVPVPVDRPPVPPPDDVDQNTAAWRRQAQYFAEYFLILLRPWKARGGTHPGSLTWADFTEFLLQLRDGSDGNGPSLVDQTRLRWLQNWSAGLRIPADDRSAVQKFRNRAATRWASETAEAHLEQEPEPRLHVHDGEHLAAAEEAIEFLRTEAHMDDRETGAAIEEALYQEVTLNHLAVAAENLTPSTAPLHPTAYHSIIYDLTKQQGIRNRTALNAPQPPRARTPPPAVIPDLPTTPTDSTHPTPETQPTVVSGLNAEQRVVFDRCATYFQQHALATRSTLQPPDPFHIFLHGGPGTGKTYLSNAIVQAAQRAGYAVSCIAPTGIAAAGLPAGRTVHNFLGIGVLGREAQLHILDAPKDARVAQFRQEHDADRLRLLIIDEISNLHPYLFGQLESQLQSLIPDGYGRPFGGLAVLITGDFFQLPPVGASNALYEPFTSYAKHEEAGQQAAALFAGFDIVDLHQQMRAAEDPAHGQMLDRLRWPVGDQTRIDLEYIQSLKVLTAADVAEDPSWAIAPVIVNSNRMRHAVNNAVSRNFARLTGQHRFVWRTPLTGTYASCLSDANREYLYQRYPGLSSFFVSGAPALLTTNVNPGLGLANGSAVIMDSLSLDDEENRRRIDHLLEHSQETDILLDYPPRYIAVRIAQPTDALKRVPDGSLKPNRGSVVAVFPISSRNPDKHHVSLGGKKFDLETLPHAVDPAFSLTVHKIQGQTCDKLIIDLNKTPIQPHLTFQGLVVLLSRVRSSTNLRLLPPPALQFHYEHLLNLKPPDKLTDWLQRLSASTSNSTAAPAAQPPTSGTRKIFTTTDFRHASDSAVCTLFTFSCYVPGGRRRPTRASVPTPAPLSTATPNLGLNPAPETVPIPAATAAAADVVSDPPAIPIPAPAPAPAATPAPAPAPDPAPDPSPAATLESSTISTPTNTADATRSRLRIKGKSWKKPRRDPL